MKVIPSVQWCIGVAALLSILLQFGISLQLGQHHVLNAAHTLG